MNITKKIVLGAAVLFLNAVAFGQTVDEGIISVDSHKYARAKQIYTDLAAKNPSAQNYFYLGNTYLTQPEPNFALATENFNKGLAADKKSYLNRIGLASVKLGRGDKSGITDIQNVVKEAKDKDAEVLFRAGEALTLYPNAANADLAVEYINKAIEKSKTPTANYYYVLGDAYRAKVSTSPTVAGDALSAYEKALPIAKNKASVYTRMATLWMAAQNWQKAKENIDKAIAADPTYAPAYKAKAGYDMRYQQNAMATKSLVNYAKYADEDPYTQLEIAKLFFTSDDYTNSKATLDKVFDRVDDPIKYKLSAYIKYHDGDYAGAKADLDKFMSTADKNRIYAADNALNSLIKAGIASSGTDAAAKSAAIAEAKASIATAKAAKDETLRWDEELAKTVGGGGAKQSSADTGPTNANIENLKKAVAANPQDTDALYKLGMEYQNAKNWDGAILTWEKFGTLLPDWAPSYYSLGYAYQQSNKPELAKMAYEKFVNGTKPAEVEQSKDALAYAYYMLATFEKDSDPAKAKTYITKSLEYKPDSQEAMNLSKVLK